MFIQHMNMVGVCFGMECLFRDDNVVYDWGKNVCKPHTLQQGHTIPSEGQVTFPISSLDFYTQFFGYFKIGKLIKILEWDLNSKTLIALSYFI